MKVKYETDPAGNGYFRIETDGKRLLYCPGNELSDNEKEKADLTVSASAVPAEAEDGILISDVSEGEVPFLAVRDRQEIYLFCRGGRKRLLEALAAE